MSVLIADSYFQKGEYEHAMSMYEALISNEGSRDSENELMYYKIKKVRCYIGLGRLDDAYTWAENDGLLAVRAEVCYYLCQAYRERGEHAKAYNLYKLGSIVPTPTGHYIDTEVYKYGIDFEGSILTFYVSQDHTQGLLLSYKVLSIPDLPHTISQCVHDNLPFYTRSIGGTVVSSKPVEYETGWYYTTPSLSNCGALVYRIVNYTITPNGGYVVHSKDGVVRTKNLLEGHGLLHVTQPQVQNNMPVEGLEDVRLVRHASTLYGLAASWEFSHVPRVVSQVLFRIDVPNLTVDVLGILSTGSRAEKNWCWAGFPFIIYSWYPHVVVLRLQLEETPRVITDHLIESIPVMRYFRGSSNGVLFKNQWWFVTHSVVDKRHSIRQYLHYLVVLDEPLNNVLRVSFPFTFEQDADIEFCTALGVSEECLEIGYSVRDGSPCFRQIPWSDIDQLWPR